MSEPAKPSVADPPPVPGGQEAVWDRFRTAYWQVLRDVDAYRLTQWERSRLTLPQLRALFEVGHLPGITIGQLAKCMGTTISTASTLVTKLVDRGLLVREVDEHDRRQMHLHLSEGGQRVGSEVRSGATRMFVEALANGVGDRLEEIASALEALVEVAARQRTP